MNRTALPYLILAASALLLLASVSGAFVQEPAGNQSTQTSEPAYYPPVQEPTWGSIAVKSDVPSLLLKVPLGQRFVITDIWLLSMEDANTPPQSGDRLFLEHRVGSNRFIVFDSPIGELSLPLRWETGPVFYENQEVWVNWDFDTKDRRLRRIHYSGYFEQVPEDSVTR